MGEIRVGVSGWTYPPWRGDFYPKGLVQREELAYAASRLTSIEINGSFYALQKPTSYQKWRDQTPDDFVFSVKGSRFITHMKRLADCAEALATFFGSGVYELGRKLGPVLWQLPGDLPVRRRAARVVLRPAAPHDARGRPVRHALEFRSQTFAQQETYDLLREHESRASWPTRPAAGPRWTRTPPTSATSGCTATRSSTPAGTTTRRWTPGRRGYPAGPTDQDVFVYFDNDAKGYAPHDAMRLIERLRRARRAGAANAVERRRDHQDGDREQRVEGADLVAERSRAAAGRRGRRRSRSSTPR